MRAEEKYTFRVFWSEEDATFVATVAEFPSLSYLSRTSDEALRGIKQLVRTILKDMKANQEPIPVPLGEKKFSGIFQVRIPPEVHRRLAVEAAEEQISLNRLVSSRLANTTPPPA